MSNFDELGDPLSLDGHSLQVFLTVLDAGSVTAAASRLGVTQSAVSHTLQKLRGILRDPLFVKSGRGIVPTAHAHALAGQARAMLEGMRAFARGAAFEPAKEDLNLTIAANDFQRDLLLPAFRNRVASQVHALRLTIVPSRAPGPELLRERHCDLIITPRPPSGADILQTKLMADKYVCFYDSGRRGPPATLEEYLSARHVMVAYEGLHPLEFDEQLLEKGVRREPAVTVPHFNGVSAFLRGGDMIASAPSLLKTGVFRDFASAPLPFQVAPFSMFTVWHRRDQNDPAHIFLRKELAAAARDVLAAVKQTPRA